MTTEIYNAIRTAIIESHRVDVETSIARDREMLMPKIGKEFNDIFKPRVTKVIEFINPKTGRKNHKTLRNQYQTFVYTQEMFDAAIAKTRERAEKDNGLQFQVCPDDSVRCLSFENINNPTENDINRVYEAYANLAEHLIGFEVETYHYYGRNSVATYSKTSPVFDEETNTKFWAARDAYIKSKAEWCAKYGCD